MKEVLISIQPKWCELIERGQKTIEVRKTKPKIDTPFKCYIYCTKSELLTKSNNNGNIYVASSKKYQNALERNGNVTLSGGVIGEFECNAILPISVKYSDPNHHLAKREFPLTGLTDREIIDYLGNGKQGYGWIISDLKIYDKPKALSEFAKPCNYNCFAPCPYYRGKEYDCEKPVITRPPQSWCYVEEKK